MTRTTGQFYRALFERHIDRALLGVRSIEGRFHHDGQPALYLSPSPEAVRVAMRAYVRLNDQPRVILPLRLEAAALLDLRNTDIQCVLGLEGYGASVNWRSERATGKLATSWVASDAARKTGCDGVIYASRSQPEHWHVVLFRWNENDGAKLERNGPPMAFSC